MIAGIKSITRVIGLEEFLVVFVNEDEEKKASTKKVLNEAIKDDKVKGILLNCLDLPIEPRYKALMNFTKHFKKSIANFMDYTVATLMNAYNISEETAKKVLERLTYDDYYVDSDAVDVVIGEEENALRKTYKIQRCSCNGVGRKNSRKGGRKCC